MPFPNDAELEFVHPCDVEARLAELGRRTGQSKEELIRQAVKAIADM
jgi:hypothetical protein